MRSLAARVATGRDDLLDTAGTGGGRRTFNVSTTAALIAAAAGCAVAKHGNRSATGLSGSADLLEALGARIDLRPEAVAACIEDVGFGFMFAPAHHQATRYVVPVRKELAVRTIFNFLGPLTNPAGARRQLIGVSDPAMLDTIAGALARLGVDRALVVAGQDGLDEISISCPTTVVEVNGEAISHSTLTPDAVGLTAIDEATELAECAGGTPEDNAAVTRAIFAGETGPRRDLAVINAGAAIYAAGAGETIADGVALAQRALDDGSAAATLERFVAATEEQAGEPVR
jgi:anthranilate phosphoribosyltransferase